MPEITTTFNRSDVPSQNTKSGQIELKLNPISPLLKVKLILFSKILLSNMNFFLPVNSVRQEKPAANQRDNRADNADYDVRIICVRAANSLIDKKPNLPDGNPCGNQADNCIQ